MATGFNVVDYMELPPAERCLVRLVLRHISMSYPNICAEIELMPANQQMSQAELDAALEHLTRSNWLIPQQDEQPIIYRVNDSQRSTSQDRRLWDGIDLEAMDSASPYDVDLSSEEESRPMKRGGKRLLPHHIWDCLAEPQEQATAARRPARRAGLLGAQFEGENEAQEK